MAEVQSSDIICTPDNEIKFSLDCLLYQNQTLETESDIVYGFYFAENTIRIIQRSKKYPGDYYSVSPISTQKKNCVPVDINKNSNMFIELPKVNEDVILFLNFFPQVLGHKFFSIRNFPLQIVRYSSKDSWKYCDNIIFSDGLRDEANIQKALSEMNLCNDTKEDKKYVRTRIVSQSHVLRKWKTIGPITMYQLEGVSLNIAIWLVKAGIFQEIFDTMGEANEPHIRVYDDGPSEKGKFIRYEIVLDKKVYTLNGNLDNQSMKLLQIGKHKYEFDKFIKDLREYQKEYQNSEVDILLKFFEGHCNIHKSNVQSIEPPKPFQSPSVLQLVFPSENPPPSQIIPPEQTNVPPFNSLLKEILGQTSDQTQKSPQLSLSPETIFDKAPLSKSSTTQSPNIPQSNFIQLTTPDVEPVNVLSHSPGSPEGTLSIVSESSSPSSLSFHSSSSSSSSSSSLVYPPEYILPEGLIHPPLKVNPNDSVFIRVNPTPEKSDELDLFAMSPIAHPSPVLAPETPIISADTSTFVTIFPETKDIAQKELSEYEKKVARLRKYLADLGSELKEITKAETFDFSDYVEYQNLYLNLNLYKLFPDIGFQFKGFIRGSQSKDYLDELIECVYPDYEKYKSPDFEPGELQVTISKGQHDYTKSYGSILMDNGEYLKDLNYIVYFFKFNNKDDAFRSVSSGLLPLNLKTILTFNTGQQNAVTASVNPFEFPQVEGDFFLYIPIGVIPSSESLSYDTVGFYAHHFMRNGDTLKYNVSRSETFFDYSFVGTLLFLFNIPKSVY